MVVRGREERIFESARKFSSGERGLIIISREKILVIFYR